MKDGGEKLWYLLVLRVTQHILYLVYTTLSNHPTQYSGLGIDRGILSTSAIERPSVYPCMTDQSHWIFMRHPSPYHIRLGPMWRESNGRGWQHCYVVRDLYSCVLNSTFAKCTCAKVPPLVKLFCDTVFPFSFLGKIVGILTGFHSSMKNYVLYKLVFCMCLCVYIHLKG